jgi:uncharacterized protein with NAD-binding domain and iron-sulfur cluster
VAVLGGGVAGLTAAHELAERGFRVAVYERKALGGKARSMDVPDSGTGGRGPLPGEHGFRFIPGIYHNLPDTMRRIPFPGNPGGVHDNLVAPKEMLFARSGGREDIRIPLPWPGNTPAELTPDEIRRALTSVLDTAFNLPLHEALYFANRFLVFLTSCDERRDDTWEQMPWWEFVRAGRMSYDYQRILAIGITRNIVATKAEEASTRTVATLLEAFAFNILGRGADGPLDRILNAPTNEAWIDPWVTYLKSLGVEFHLGWTVRDLTLDSGRIARAVMEDPGGRPPDRHRRPLHFGHAGRARPTHLELRRTRRRPPTRRVRPAGDGLDDRHPVLSDGTYADPARPPRPHRLPLVADRDRPGPALAGPRLPQGLR